MPHPRELPVALSLGAQSWCCPQPEPLANWRSSCHGLHSCSPCISALQWNQQGNASTAEFPKSYELARRCGCCADAATRQMLAGGRQSQPSTRRRGKDASLGAPFCKPARRGIRLARRLLPCETGPCRTGRASERARDQATTISASPRRRWTLLPSHPLPSRLADFVRMPVRMALTRPDQNKGTEVQSAATVFCPQQGLLSTRGCVRPRRRPQTTVRPRSTLHLRREDVPLIRPFHQG